MQIFLCGSSGQGKTTVGKLLSEKYDEDHVTDVSRTSPYTHGTKDHQKYLHSKIGKLSTAPGVHDRTLIDVLAYNYAFDFTSLNANLIQDIEVWSNTKPCVVYFPVLLDVEDDGVRTTDFKTNADVDQMIRRTLYMFLDDGFLTLPLASPEERVKMIERYMEGHNANLFV